MKIPLFGRIALFILLIFIACGFKSAVWGQAADKVNKAKDSEIGSGDDLDLTQNEFKSETKIGAVFSTGNTQSITVDGSSFTLYRIKRWENKWNLGAYFNRVDSSVANPTAIGTIAKYIFGFYRLDYYFLPRTTVYVGGGGFVDEIKGIELAWEGFVGIAHYFLKTPTYSLRTSFGYDYTYEDRLFPDPDESLHSVSFGLLYTHQFNKIVGFRQNVVALENVVHGQDIRVNSDTELKVNMTKHLGLVVGFHLRFDNQPVTGFKKLDTISDVSLAVTFGGENKVPAP